MMISQAHLTISGRVQGVYYRVSCMEKAQSLCLTGWVKNLTTGQVEILAQGEKEKIEKLIEWCWMGSSGSVVTEVQIKWEEEYVEISDQFIVVR